METSIWLHITEIVGGVLAGGGLWAWIKAREDKRKTPYDMFMEMLQEQKRFYEDRNADYEREKLDSAEKSSVIMQSQFCKHKYKDPEIVCPVDTANDERLKKRCDRCNVPSKDNHVHRISGKRIPNPPQIDENGELV